MSRDGKSFGKVLEKPPSFDTAPEWGMWLAQDEDGDWWWFSNKPTLCSMPDDGALYWARTTGENVSRAEFAGKGVRPLDPSKAIQERPSAKAE